MPPIGAAVPTLGDLLRQVEVQTGDVAQEGNARLVHVEPHHRDRTLDGLGEHPPEVGLADRAQLLSPTR